jgi:hypothetical protein
MSYNKILERLFLRTISLKGKSVELYAATSTENWKRPSELAQKVEEPFTKVIEDNSEQVPEGTVSIVARYVSLPKFLLGLKS